MLFAFSYLKRFGSLAVCLMTLIRCMQVVADEVATDFFEKQVRPVLAERCFKCHSAQSEKLKGGLLLDSREGMIKGGDDGPALSPGSPEKSRLIEAISYSNVDLQMPPKGKLPDEQIKALTDWVKMGAPWPTSDAGAAKAVVSSFDLHKRKSEHWAWQSLRKSTPPIIENDQWSKTEIDKFILARLKAQRLSPAPPADKRTLIRRATFDLLGLPATPAEVDAFLADTSPDAFERIVDRLLASTHFGERWGRHWLDLVRYAETMGHEFDYQIPFAWRYRDYVIRAFNADLPYKQFVTEHIAGDLIVPPRTDPATGNNESILGTSFFWFAQQSHSPVDIKAAQAVLIENQIDVVSKTFLSMTVACARCHDHKFDAISSKDYYALYGVLESSRFTFAPINPPVQFLEPEKKLESIKESLKNELAAAWLDQASMLTNISFVPGSTKEDSNNDKDEVFADFTSGSSDNWFPTGPAFRIITHDELLITGDSNKPVRLAGHSQLRSDSDSRKLQGAYRSPTFTIDRDFIHVRAGGDNSRINIVIDNFNLIRSPIYGGLKAGMSSTTPKWYHFDVKNWVGHRACVELEDFALPDPADERGYGPVGYLFAEKVIFSNQKEIKASTASTATGPDSKSVQLSQTELRETIERWKNRTSSEPDSDLLSSLLDRGTLKLPKSEKFEKLLAAYSAIEKTIPDPALAPVMAEGSGLDENLFIRGNPKSLGDKVPRRFLEACTSPHLSPFKNGSGRKELAEALTSPANPMPSRAAVNWTWHHLFGRGLVATVDNFGVLGERPTHPELLDSLALKFQDQGGSFKHLIREMMLSASYQMASDAIDSMAEEKDPGNLLLHRARVRRLEAEPIRDSMLAISGSLNPAQFGPPVPMHLTDFMDGRGRPSSSGPLDGAGRRTIYLEVRRNFLDPMMLAFDYPIPATTIGRRSESNVPAQALTLLNDPFIVGEAENWAKASLKSHSDLKSEDRVNELYLAAFSRTPDATECREALEFLKQQERLNGPGAGAEKSWADFCHVLFNVKEFIFLK